MAGDVEDLTTLKLVRGTASGRQIGFGLQDDVGARPADESKGERQLGIFVLPPFQRPPAWNVGQKVRWIESIWLGLPLPAFVFNTCEKTDADHGTDMWLLDGQQRWTAIYGYVAGEFEVFGRRFADLSEVERREFKRTNFSAVEMKSDDVALLREVYDRLAYGGTPHDLPSEDEVPGMSP